MKEIIFSRSNEPSKKEICERIQHFCREHSMACSQIPRKNFIRFKIDGEIYQVNIRRDEGESPVWIVSCTNSKEGLPH